MRETPLEALTRLHKALAHPVRVRMLAMLRRGELCVCQLNAVIGLAPSTVSAHLAELKDAGLVAERKAGRWVHYRLAAEGAGEATLSALWPAIEKDQQVADDRRLLHEVTNLPVETICRPGFNLAALRARCCRPARVRVKE
jgi:ArsR family transcriptional regulator, arsenate/arsenite/antimonite-responsive transcriptional repressor